MLDYIRIACAVPAVTVGNPEKNAEEICRYIQRADQKDCDLILFPELAVSGYTCADLFFQRTLQEGVQKALDSIVGCTVEHPALTAVVGLPVMIDGQLYNCAAVIRDGIVQGLIPKTFIPNHDEFDEVRWFASAADLQRNSLEAHQLGLDAWYSVPVGADLVFRLGDGALVGVEICEDLWAPVSPSAMLALGGAEVIVNLAASNETAGKRMSRRQMVKQQSWSCSCIYAFCSAGADESGQDMIFSGHSIFTQNGKILDENTELIAENYMMICDGDLGVIRSERSRKNTFREAAGLYGKQFPVRICESLPKALRSDGTMLAVEKMPFVPAEETNRQEDCNAVFEIQVAALRRRLGAIGAKAVVGVSGGLDSTLALLVAVEAMRRLGRPLTDVHGVTMPCFGTTDRTCGNAVALITKLGITCKHIDIIKAVTGHFEDIGHDPALYDATYENAQARERTQVLMDYAGMVGGIVVGTGDLSELALGWCTYNGDHMSMFAVNAAVPKTLISPLIRTICQRPDFTDAKTVLEDILDTPISPELLPPDVRGDISQRTENIVGPYALHDFFLYYMLRFDFSPAKIFALACRAFADEYDRNTVKKWLIVFYQRFFSQQFKRNCMPDGVKTGDISLSPRAGWRMPSDGCGRIWLEEVQRL